MAENTLQFEWIVLIKLGLEACFVDRDDVFVAGDLFWYPLEGRPDVRQAPDVLVAIGRPKGHRGSYMQWLEGHIPPQVVFEILSPGNRAGEMAKKFEFYRRYGVQEYYLYDPEKNWLEGYNRKGPKLAEIPKEDLKNWTSPLLDIRFEWSTETLRLYQFNGKQFLSYLELLKSNEEAIVELRENRRRIIQLSMKLQDAEDRAETAELQAELSQRRAVSAEERAKKLAERLRALGINPDEE